MTKTATAESNGDGTVTLSVPATPFLGTPQIDLPKQPTRATTNGSAANGQRTQPAYVQTTATKPLWSTRELSVWAIVLFAAIVACFVAYLLSAGKATLSSQAGSLNIAMVSLVVAGGANAWLLAAGRRSIGLRRRALFGEPVISTAAKPVAAVVAAPESTTLVADPGLKRFHRSDCALVAGRGWTASSRAEHEQARRQPCGVCQP